MLVEIPDPEVILSVILAFIVGIVGLYAYFKIRPFVKTKSEVFDASPRVKCLMHHRLRD
jgi:hypothetical protein